MVLWRYRWRRFCVIVVVSFSLSSASSCHWRRFFVVATFSLLAAASLLVAASVRLCALSSQSPSAFRRCRCCLLVVGVVFVSLTLTAFLFSCCHRRILVVVFSISLSLSESHHCLCLVLVSGGAPSYGCFHRLVHLVIVVIAGVSSSSLASPC